MQNTFVFVCSQLPLKNTRLHAGRVLESKIMIIRFRKLHIKAVKSNPLAQKIKEKQENSLRNCRSKNGCLVELFERNLI